MDKKHFEETCDGRCFESKQDFRKPLGTTRKRNGFISRNKKVDSLGY